jgi:hypothetical protein
MQMEMFYRSREMDDKLKSRIEALDARINGDMDLAEVFKKDREGFLKDMEFSPEEISAVRAMEGEEDAQTRGGKCKKTNAGLTVGETVNPVNPLPCSCCAVAWSSCGTGCAPRPVGGNTVG